MSTHSRSQSRGSRETSGLGLTGVDYGSKTITPSIRSQSSPSSPTRTIPIFDKPKAAEELDAALASASPRKRRNTSPDRNTLGMARRPIPRSPLMQNLSKSNISKSTAEQEEQRRREKEEKQIDEVDNFLEEVLNLAYRQQSEHFMKQEDKRRIMSSASRRVASVPAPMLADIPLVSCNFATETVDAWKGGAASLPQRRISYDSKDNDNSATVQRSISAPPNSNNTPEPSGTGQFLTVGNGDSRRQSTSKRSQSGLSGTPSTSHQPILKVPNFLDPRSKKRKHRKERERNNKFYFTSKERASIEELVLSKAYSCTKHENCTDCLNSEFAFHELKAMPTSLAPNDRQTIISNNRSLRNIKNELENLMEKGAISDEAYDTIMKALPDETSFNGSRSNATSPAPSAPVAAFNNLSVSNDAPPAYNRGPSGPPALPNRTPSATPSRPEIGQAVALYQYRDNEGGLNFEAYDQIIIHEFSNAEWWDGKNVRTGQEGVFPANYVQLKTESNKLPPAPNQFSEKQGVYGGHYQPQPQYQPAPVQQQYNGPPAPGPSNPYNSSVPPMAVAEQPTGEEKKPGKGAEMGKKFGKKLGNAAIFGAGATLGGNLVNSIF